MCVCVWSMYNHMTKLHGYMEDSIRPTIVGGIHIVWNKIQSFII